MIIDTIQNAAKHYTIHESFAAAFEYIKNADLLNAADQKVEISKGLKAIFNNAMGKSKENSCAKFECHNKNIDIQLCISGTETIGWKPRKKCIIPNGEYNAEKDVQLFSDATDMFFQLTNSQFAIFFPEDVHAPMIGENVIKKLVIKVEI